MPFTEDNSTPQQSHRRSLRSVFDESKVIQTSHIGHMPMQCEISVTIINTPDLKFQYTQGDLRLKKNVH